MKVVIENFAFTTTPPIGDADGTRSLVLIDAETNIEVHVILSRDNAQKMAQKLSGIETAPASALKGIGGGNGKTK